MVVGTFAPSTLRQVDEELHTDAKVDLNLLAHNPVAALLPLLRHLSAWRQVCALVWAFDQAGGLFGMP